MASRRRYRPTARNGNDAAAFLSDLLEDRHRATTFVPTVTQTDVQSKRVQTEDGPVDVQVPVLRLDAIDFEEERGGPPGRQDRAAPGRG